MKEAFKTDSEEQMADMYYYVKEWSITKLTALSGVQDQEILAEFTKEFLLRFPDDDKKVLGTYTRAAIWTLNDMKLKSSTEKLLYAHSELRCLDSPSTPAAHWHGCHAPRPSPMLACLALHDACRTHTPKINAGNAHQPAGLIEALLQDTIRPKGPLLPRTPTLPPPLDVDGAVYEVQLMFYAPQPDDHRINRL
eukprot:2594742-Rhodomonas_salina.1